MKNVILYRIEYTNGKGFYNSGYDFDGQLNDIKNKHCELFDSIDSVCDDFIHGTHFCAFVNIKALKYAMTYEELELLISLGFNVLKLTVKTALIGNDELQAAYDKRDIVKVQNINNQINKLYK